MCSLVSKYTMLLLTVSILGPAPSVKYLFGADVVTASRLLRSELYFVHCGRSCILCNILAHKVDASGEAPGSR